MSLVQLASFYYLYQETATLGEESRISRMNFAKSQEQEVGRELRRLEHVVLRESLV